MSWIGFVAPGENADFRFLYRQLAQNTQVYTVLCVCVCFFIVLPGISVFAKLCHSIENGIPAQKMAPPYLGCCALKS